MFNITPFYPESGGQVGDKGYLKASNGAIHYIIDTKKENDLIIHYSKTLPTDLNEKFTAGVDEDQRFKTACNHTATHLMHQARGPSSVPTWSKKDPWFILEFSDSTFPISPS